MWSTIFLFVTLIFAVANIVIWRGLWDNLGSAIVAATVTATSVAVLTQFGLWIYSDGRFPFGTVLGSIWFTGVMVFFFSALIIGRLNRYEHAFALALTFFMCLTVVFGNNWIWS